MLVDTVRDAIAECSEVAYTSLGLAAARQMMMFDDEKQLLDFVADAAAALALAAAVEVGTEDADQRAAVDGAGRRLDPLDRRVRVEGVAERGRRPWEAVAQAAGRQRHARARGSVVSESDGGGAHNVHGDAKHEANAEGGDKWQVAEGGE